MKKNLFLLLLVVSFLFPMTAVQAKTDGEQVLKQTTGVVSGVVVGPAVGLTRGFVKGWMWGTDATAETLGKKDGGVQRTVGFLTGGVLECDLVYHRSVAELSMLCNIRCNPTHSLCSALPVPYVPVLFTRGALVAHRYTYAPPCCRTSQYCRTFFPSHCLSRKILLALCSMVSD